jgi:hypothetical protein
MCLGGKKKARRMSGTLFRFYQSHRKRCQIVNAAEAVRFKTRSLSGGRFAYLTNGIIDYSVKKLLVV